VVLLPERTGHGCVSPSRRVQGRTGRRGGPYTYEGAGGADLAGVRPRFRRRDGRRGVVRADVARAIDARTLRAVGIGRPFLVWRAIVPPGATEIRAEGLSREGTIRWTARDPLAQDETPQPPRYAGRR